MSEEPKPIPPEKLREIFSQIIDELSNNGHQIQVTKERLQSLAETISEYEETFKHLIENINQLEAEQRHERDRRESEVRALKDDQSKFGSIAFKLEIDMIKSELKSLKSRIDKPSQGLVNMNTEQILKEIDEMIAKSKQNGALADEEIRFFNALKKRTEEIGGFFARMRKNAGIKEKE